MAKVKEETGKTHPLRVRLSTIAPDRVQYKPYSPTFMLDNVWVTIQIPIKYVERSSGNAVDLTPEGIAFLYMELAKISELTTTVRG